MIQPPDPHAIPKASAYQTSSLYLDESGSRHPDRAASSTRHGHDWFGIGGILIDDGAKDRAKIEIEIFRSRWPQLQNHPLHSHEIRGGQKNFTWLRDDRILRNRFLDDLTGLLIQLPVIGFACVINRRGHNLRYKDRYTANRWLLCKTAFAIVVERAAKHCLQQQRKLRVNIERSGKSEEKALKSYYDELRKNGHWFNPNNAAKYAPLSALQYQSCLYDFKVKTKSSHLMNVADLYLWPMCIGGYEPENRAYDILRQAGKLIDDRVSLEDKDALGVKYSCFDKPTQQY